jgi:hypothetical protein
MQFSPVSRDLIQVGPLLPSNGVFSGCGWRRRPAVIEGYGECIKQSRTADKGWLSSLGAGPRVNK